MMSLLTVLWCSCLLLAACVLLLSSPAAAQPPDTELFSFTGGAVMNPFSVMLDAQGRIYISDTELGQVTVLAPLPSPAPAFFTQVIATFNDGGATGSAQCATVDGEGNIYLCDGTNNRILVLAGVDSVSPAAGSRLFAFDSFSPPMQAPGPDGLALDSNGSIYISDRQQAASTH